MKIQTTLYYRYLMRQTMIMNVATLLIASVISFVCLFSHFLDRKTSIIVSSVIWLLPIYSISVFFVWMFKFLKSKSELKELELYKRISNTAIRERVVKSNIKIKYLITSKSQDKNFFEVIAPEIEKQKKLLAIQKGKYR